MTTAQDRFRSVQRRNAEYEHDAARDSVIAESERAIHCFDFAELVKQGADVLESINGLDDDWRRMIFTKVLPFEQAFEDEIRNLYVAWLATTEKVLGCYQVIEADFLARGFSVEHVAFLQAGVREVRGILTSDAEFFNSSALVDLRDKAIDDFHNGNCEMVG